MAPLNNGSGITATDQAPNGNGTNGHGVGAKVVIPPRPAAVYASEEWHENIPDELRDEQWVTWRYEWEEKDEAWKKPPKFAAAPKFAASHSNPKGWGDFKTAVQSYLRCRYTGIDGIGRVFTKTDPFTGIDFDKCLAPDGSILPWALPFIEPILPSYGEISPSGTGLKFWVKGALSKGGEKKLGFGPDELGAIEIYDTQRFFTVTGNIWPGSAREVLERQNIVDVIYALPKRNGKTGKSSTVGGARAAVASKSGSLSVNDRLDKARQSSNGAKFSRLYDDGDTSLNGGDDSSADMALANLLAYWLGRSATHADIEAAFSASALGQRDKWQTRPDYRASTIGKALEGRTSFYDPSYRSNGNGKHAGNGQVGGTEPKADPAKASAQAEVLDDRPHIECHDRDLDVVTRATLGALAAKNDPPEMFQSGGHLAHIKPPPDDDGSGRLVIEIMGNDSIRNRLAEVAHFEETKQGKYGEVVTTIFPPRDLVRAVASQKTWSDHVAPPLDLIVRTPRFEPGGNLILQPGYHRKARLFYQPAPSIEGLQVPERPDAEEIKRAVQFLLEDYLGDMCFEDQSSRANALVNMLLPFVREEIDGPTPMHEWSASTEGTGKGRGANAVAYPALGHAIHSTTQKEGEAEWRKALTSFFMTGSTHAFFDNINNPKAWDGTRSPIDSGVLAMALTQPVYEDRILGGNNQFCCKIRNIFMCSGNNTEWSRELTRRIVRIRLRSPIQDPSTRTGFRCAPKTLEQWAEDKHKELVQACLTICRAWYAEDRPSGKQVMGTYEIYAKVMGGILDVAGVAGFLENRPKTTKDRETSRWVWFVQEWAKAFQSKPVTSGQLYGMVRAFSDLEEEFADILGDKSELSQKQRLGHTLKNHIDRVWGDFRIVQTSIKGKGQVPTFKLIGKAEETKDEEEEPSLSPLSAPETPQNDAEWDWTQLPE